MSYSFRQSTRATNTLPVSQDTNTDSTTINTNNDSDTNGDTTEAHITTTTSAANSTPVQANNDEEDSDDNPSTTTTVEDEEEPPVLKFWNGEPPSATGTLATLFTDTETQASLEACEEMANFLYQEDNVNKADKIHFDTDLIPFLAAVPGSPRQLRLVFGVGTGLGLTGIHSNTLDTRILALSGEYEAGVSFPTVLQFPSDALSPKRLNIPSFNQFNEQIQLANNRPHWFKYGDLTTEAQLPLLVPFPAVYISDGFDGDIDAAEVFERINAIPRKHQDSIKTAIHLLSCFCAASAVKYNKSDPSIFAPTDAFMIHSSPLLNKWKKQKMTSLFPMLENTTPTTVTVQPPTPTTPTPQDNNTWSPEAFIKAFTAIQHKSPTSPATKDAEIGTSETLGMGSFAYHLLLDLCGLAPSTADEIIPLWTQLAEKNLSKSDKLTFVRRSIESRVKWTEAKVLPLNALLTMVVNRTWEGETTLSSLTSAAKGLTPFAVPCLSESEVTSQNDLAEALAAASSTTVKDHSNLKLVATAPSSFDGLVKRIKRFGNLLFAIFGDTSALFMQMEDMIVALDGYGEHARSTMTHQTIASILWITHLQARHYSAGAMKGDNAIKAEFTTMMNAILTKAPVLHMDTPPKLFQAPNNNKRSDRSSNGQDSQYAPQEPKKPKPNDSPDRFQLVERNVMNNKMKQAMTPILNLKHIPNMGKICRAARINAGELFPQHKDICIRSQVLGKCFVSCTHKHIKLSDEDIENALKLLKPVISNPSLLKVN
jgi:hypothetical protein